MQRIGTLYQSECTGYIHSPCIFQPSALGSYLNKDPALLLSLSPTKLLPPSVHENDFQSKILTAASHLLRGGATEQPASLCFLSWRDPWTWPFHYISLPSALLGSNWSTFPLLRGLSLVRFHHALRWRLHEL